MGCWIDQKADDSVPDSGATTSCADARVAGEELVSKLAERGHSREDAAAALSSVRAWGLQSDAAYAEAYARHAWRVKRWAPGRVGRELRRKGCADTLADAAIEAVFGAGGGRDAFVEPLGDDGDAEVEYDPLSPGQRRASMREELVASARRRWQSSQRVGDVQKRQRRLFAWMAARGHDYGTFRDVMAAIKADEEAEATDDDDAHLG